jgi:hypothetical protein
VPRSILLGRPWPQPGEPLFTDEDTAYVIALAQEKRDHCPSCGLLKAVCRHPDYQFAFEVEQDQCHATAALAAFQNSEAWTGKHAVTKDATQLSVRFRDGKQPPLDVGLQLEHVAEDDDQDY